MSNYFEKVWTITTQLAEIHDIHESIVSAVKWLAEAIGAQDGTYMRYKNGELSLHTGLYEDTSPVMMDIARTMLSTSDTIYTDASASTVAVRLMGNKQILGVLVFRGSRTFGEDDVRLVKMVSRTLENTIHIARLQQTVQKYSRFNLDIAREIRSPLTPLVGYTDLMMMGGSGDINEMQRVFLRNIRDAADRVMILMDGIMNLGRLDAGEALSLNLSQVNIEDVLKSVFDQSINRPHHGRKNLNTSLNFEGQLPLIDADKDKLVQIFAAVIDNALDYTRPGGRVEIDATVTDNGSYILIKVEDNGVGIQPTMQESVWQRFERDEEDVVALEVVGTGLGLTLVRELVRLHHGRAWFESERDKGTTFYIQLPVRHESHSSSSS